MYAEIQSHQNMISYSFLASLLIDVCHSLIQVIFFQNFPTNTSNLRIDYRRKLKIGKALATCPTRLPPKKGEMVALFNLG